MKRIVLCLLGLCVILLCVSSSALAANAVEVNLRDFGAVGDGETDDAPAFQKALDALAAAGGGTLFIPAGKYVIATPVTKNFAGLASSITIRGVESLTPVSPPTAPGHELSLGLDLPTEIYPRTGEPEIAIGILGLKSLLVKDIAFVGTPTARTDAAITLLIREVEKARVEHCEFYGLSTLASGGALIEAIRSDLEVTKCKFLGSTATSGGYLPLVQNLEWLGVTVTDTIFIDYGQRPDFFSKTYLAAPISWINVGNAAPPTNRSPRREVVLRNVFLDEGGYWGFTSLPYRYMPESAPIDLIYVTGLWMNVSNFNQFGHKLYDARRVFIEKSHYGWSQNALAAISLNNIGSAIFDQLDCVADADHLYADANTKELIVINSTFAQLDSEAELTKTINTTDENDPVQYVRRRFVSELGRDPDPAAHYYWSDLLIHCFDDSSCQDSVKQTFSDYLATQPAAKFAISGRVANEQGDPSAGVTITISGSQNVTTVTDEEGNYIFTNLPTSGAYTVTPSKDGDIFDSANATFVTPSGDRVANFISDRSTRLVKGLVTENGNPIAGVTLSVTGSTNSTVTTDGAGAYSFIGSTHGDYVFTPAKAHYTFAPATRSVSDLRADTQLDFAATLQKHSISGRVLTASGEPVAGAIVTLSGSINRTTNTSSDGSYSFNEIDGGSGCIVTVSKTGFGLTPPSQTFHDLAGDVVADFQVRPLPVLLNVAGTDQAIALELTRFISGPFPLTNTLLAAGRNRTRIIVFATDLGLLPGEGVEVLTAEAEDDQVRYPLRVEFVGPLPELPNVMQIVLRLNDDLDDAGEVLVNVTSHGMTSNKVRIAINP